MNKIKYILLIILVFLAINVQASTTTYERSRDNLGVNDWITVTNRNIDDILKTPKVDANEKVYDFADLFSDAEETEIYNKISAYSELSHFDLAVVTINENNKRSEVEYADNFYDYNDFGFNETRDGMIFLIDMDNRQIYISTNGYAVRQYDDYRIDQIIDAGYDNLRNQKYAQCILQMINESTYYIGLGIPSGNENLIIDGHRISRGAKPLSTAQKIGIVVGLSATITLIVAIVMYHKTRLKIKVGSLQSYFISAKNPQRNDQFLRSAISRVPIHTESSGSGGGGSSFHSSSSGGFHGGGGRGF